ncbi:MAG TPA: alpha-2-macroglobulin [Rhizomicrobium sp.]
MNRRTFVIGGVVAAVVIVAVVGALYLAGGKHAPSGGVWSRIAGGFSQATSTVTSTMTPKQMAEAPEFAFHRLEIGTSKPQAEACLVFTRDLDQSGHTHYEDYLTVDPQTRIVVRAMDARVCIAGLDFNTTYTVTLKKGLPDRAGDKLAEAETVSVELRDKPALVRFSGGIVLPRDNADGVPVTTVNVDKLALKIVRVGDRLLSQIESGTVDQTQLYSYDAKQLEQNQGQVVWSGAMDVANVKNDTVVTLIPIRDILKGKPPGAYVLIAQDWKKAHAKTNDEDDYSEQMASQWVIDSDISITTFQGAGGLTVFTRSYASAKAMGGVKLTLVARDNNVLSTQTTGADGHADFDAGFFNGKGGDEPVVVMAYGQGGDFSFLDLRRPAFDLTDRGVGGRETSGPIDAYLYTERGVYRPGETIRATAMLRDRVGAAVTAPLTLVATRPDGMEVARATFAGASLAAGAATWSVPLRDTSPHGRYQIAAYVDTSKDAPAVGRVQFDIADFVPQRLKVTLTPETKVLHPNSDIKVRADSRFLYGAPASNLSGEGHARITKDAAPYPEFKQYQFGRVDDTFSDVSLDLTVPDTDANGSTEATGTIGDLADTTLPLKAVVTVSIHEPGGRTTDKSVDIPVRTHDAAIGIRPDFDGDAVPEGARAGFEVIAVNNNGKRIALNNVNYSWVREVTTYQWYQDNGEWKYQSVTRDRLIASGTMNIAASGAVKMAQAFPWGDYRLTVSDPKTGAASSYRFYSGWAASAAGDRPDRIPVAADKPSYKPGDIAHVQIKPASDGQALVVVAGDKVFSSQLVNAPASGATIDVPVSEDWGAGAYVLVTHYHPLNGATGREPVRSIGVTWLQLDNSARTLTAVVGGPQKVTPRQRITIPVTVTGLDQGEDAYITLAAVDEGILQLTDFKSPDPNTWYFGKRRLGVGMHDDYGRLIKPEKAPVGSLREGGDNFGGRPLAVVPQRTVALFSGLVKLGAGGRANVPLDIPDFNGELRLMAVAWSGKKVGHADRPLTVRDPVVAELVLPRFLAPGDKAQAALMLDNVEGAAGNYAATIKTSGPVATAAGAQTVVAQSLKHGQRTLTPVELDGKGLGIASISLTLTGPNNFKISRAWPIQVRAPQLDVAREDVAVLGAGQSYTANQKLVSDIVPSTMNVAINVSAAHGYTDVPGLLRWLDKYPYGCIEQTTSRAMPLLYFNDLATLAGLPKDQALHDRIQEAVDNVLDMQNYAGNFGMWGPGNDADPWISVFALDFLYQAKAKGYVVPNEAIKRGAGWLKQIAPSDSNDDATRAYAFYVLARAGQVNLSDLRYFSDTRGGEWNNAIAGALTGAAAAQAGDRARATYAFNRARDILMNAKPVNYSEADYGSFIRDLAGTTALVVEGGDPQLVPALMQRTTDVDMRLNDTTTQEKAWMLRAAYELTREKTPLNIVVNGQPAQPKDGAVRLSPNYGMLAKGVTVGNRGDAPVWRDVSVQGTPAIPLPPTANGLTIKKTVWTVSGQPADLANLHQNDRVMVVLEGQMDNAFYRQMGAIDLLPAGLEIEMPISGDDAKAYAWLSSLNDVTMEDARDDRFVAAFTIGTQYQEKPDPKKPPPPLPTYRIAYIARAVTQGTFVMPAGVVEDMYSPTVIARTDMGSVTVKR